MKLARCCAILAFAFLVALPVAYGEWQAPEKPDPNAILDEARADVRAKRYEDALAKLLWFHENALKYDDSQRGVRLSFALSEWYDLGADYAPALASFEEVRAAARKSALESAHSKHIQSSFIDFAAMSKKLRRENDTVELFLELHKQNVDDAKLVYSRAEEALVRAERFDLCDEFLDAEPRMEQLIELYKLNMKLAKEKEERFGKQLQSFGERRFRHDAATIVVILAKNGKDDEARELAQKARDAWDDKQLNEALDQALAGTPPKAFP